MAKAHEVEIRNKKIRNIKTADTTLQVQGVYLAGKLQGRIEKR